MPVIILLLITIIYSRKLSYREYGIFQSVWMYANIVNVIVSFGISAIILSSNLTFLLSFIKKKKQVLVPFYSLLTMFVLTALFFFSKNFSNTERFLLIAFIIIQNIITVAETLLIKQGGEKKALIINFFYSLFFFGWHLYILFSGYSLMNLMIGVSVISMCKLVPLLLFPVSAESNEQTTSDKPFLTHWAYVGINEVLGIISKWIDKIFLLYLLTSADFAVFFNGSFEIPLFGLLVSVTGSLLLIEISGSMQLTDKITVLFRENFNMLSWIVFPLFFFLFFFRHEIYHLVFKNKYNVSVPIFAISLLTLPARINSYSVILQCFSKGKIIMWGSILDILIALMLMIILYPHMGTRGIALAIVIATYCQVIFYLWHSATTVRLPITRLVPFKELAIKFLILLLLYLILSLLLRSATMSINLTIGFLVTIAIMITGMWSYFKSFFINSYGKSV